MARNRDSQILYKRIGAAFAAWITAATIVGCVGPNAFYLSSVPTSPLRAGQTFQFVASLNGNVQTTGVTWTVLPGGSPAQNGTVTQTGLYTAPTVLQGPVTVNVQAELKGNESTASTMPVQVLPPVPEITAVSSDVLTPGSFSLQIGGINFTPQTAAYINGAQVTFSDANTSTANVTGILPPGATQASLVLQNPGDPAKSSPFTIAIDAPNSAFSSGGGGAQAISLPTSPQPLTGCGNPNTGSSTNDWGVGSDPVYTTVNTVTPVVGTPTYTSNSIFWVSRETGPGQSVLMTGAFTDTAKTARVAFIPPGTVNWQALVEASSTVVPTSPLGTTALSFVVPADFPTGVYGFEIDDSSTSPIFHLANVPSVNWAIGVPSVTDPGSALQHQVYDCGAEPGGVLRVFGKNFVPSSQVIIQSQSGATYTLEPSKIDTNSISAPVPSTLTPGSYDLWVGSSPWSATSSPTAQITIFSPPSFSVSYATCSTLLGDGATDNTAQLQACLDNNAPPPGEGQIVYIEIPAGKFVLTGGIKPRSYEILVGASAASTIFLGRPPTAAPTAWFTVPQYFGLTHLSLQAPANPYLLVSSDSTTGSPLDSGHLFFNDVNFQSTTDMSHGSEQMFYLAGPDIQVYNSSFLSGSNQVFDIHFADGAIASGNEFVVNSAGLGVVDSQNVIFEDNLIYSQNTPGGGANGEAGGAGLSISRANSQFGPSAISQDIYVGYNTFRNMGARDQQIIVNDGDGGSYYGPIASSTASTVVLADNPSWNWMGTTNPQASSIAIVSGTGLGQYSLVRSYSAQTINLMTPWKVPPDSTSVVAITQYELNMTFAHNTIIDTLGTSIVLADSLEGVIEDNSLTNSGDGILISAFCPYGGPAAYGSVLDTDVLRNTIAVGNGNFITPSANTNIAGIGVSDFPGCLASGLLIRSNVLPSMNTIYNTDGSNGLSGNLIEQNQANWAGFWTQPQVLIQANTP